MWKYYVHILNKKMRSNCFDKHVATKVEFPQVLTVNCSKTFPWIWSFQLYLKKSTLTNVLYFVCKHAEMPTRKKTEEFCKGCDTNP